MFVRYRGEGVAKKLMSVDVVTVGSWYIELSFWLIAEVLIP